jgi:hypothetical protein
MKLFRYQREDGENLLQSGSIPMRDKFAQARIRIRLRQAGNFGDCER